MPEVRHALWPACSRWRRAVGGEAARGAPRPTRAPRPPRRRPPRTTTSIMPRPRPTRAATLETFLVIIKWYITFFFVNLLEWNSASDIDHPQILLIFLRLSPVQCRYFFQSSQSISSGDDLKKILAIRFTSWGSERLNNKNFKILNVYKIWSTYN